MPIIQKRVALAANGTSSPLSGSQYEFLPFDAQIEIGIQADATGVLASIFSGSDVLMQEDAVQIGTINVFPKYPDDFYLRDVAAAGERLAINLRDTSGAARVVTLSVMITPIL